MRIRRDSAFIASVLFTMALLCLVPWTWRYAFLDQTAIPIDESVPGFGIAMLHKASPMLKTAFLVFSLFWSLFPHLDVDTFSLLRAYANRVEFMATTASAAATARHRPAGP